MTITGIDVSGYQSETYDLSGHDFVFVKATEGVSYTNPRHAAQVTRARNNDRVVGHYHYLNSNSMSAQMDYFLRQADAKAGDLLAVDWEETSVTSAQKDQALKYLQKQAPGHRVLLYCNRDFWLNRDTSSYRADGLWIAQYNGHPGSPDIDAAWVVHQYTSDPIDTNVAAFSSRSAMAAWAAGTTDQEDDMPQEVNLGSASYTLKPGGWDSIEYTTEWIDETGDHASGGSVFARGACKFSGTLSLHVKGLAPGETVQVRMSEYTGDNFVQDHPIDEAVGTGGDTYHVTPLVKHLASGHSMRVRLLNTSASPVTVTSAVLTALVWK
ncbi:glycoside hydrolase family 25 protein [Streptomyces sp. NPDC090306]|uniref:glycoside hydrolase family 25 protein n=1 Tax=unclassified Streptomyces TaxID=2593676 RepID=UPI0036EAECFC